MDRTEYITSFTPTGRLFAQTSAALLLGLVLGASFSNAPAMKSAARAEGTSWTQAHTEIPNAPLPAELPSTF